MSPKKPRVRQKKTAPTKHPETHSLFRASVALQRAGSANAAAQKAGEGDIVMSAIHDTHARLLDLVEEDMKQDGPVSVLVEDM